VDNFKNIFFISYILINNLDYILFMGEGIMLDLFGFYKYYGQMNRLNGNIDILQNGAFIGDIYDYNSRSPQQKIRGHIVREGDIAKLIFLKFPPNQNLANLLYQLESPITNMQPFSFRRDFKGSWQALPYKIEYNKDYKLFIAKIDTSVIGIGDEAGITISA
jgi:hypothetical protein